MRFFAEILVLFMLLVAGRGWASPDGRFDGDGLRHDLDFKSLPVEQVEAVESDGDARLWVELRAADKKARTAALEAGMAIEEVRGDRIMGVAQPEAVSALAARGLEVVSAVGLLERFAAKDFPKEDAAFHNYSETEEALRALAKAAPSLASVFPVGKSLLGRDILALRLNAVSRGSAASSKPGIVFMGNHHAREHLSNEVPLLLAKHLVENRSKPDIAALLATRDIYFIPMVNPDGVEYDVSGDRYHMQRKNMRANADKSVGVDLNRNYGWHWCEGGASTNPRSETYCGTAAFSEPESAAMKAFVEARPNIKILMSYHTFSELVLYPWGYTDDPIADGKAHAAYKAMAESMAKMTGYTAQQSSELYIASGDTTDWAWATRGIFSFTIELSPKSQWDGGFYPGVQAIATSFAANLRPALYLIGLADDPYRAAPSAPAAGVLGR
ncbi:MAG: zinc carboxypeptidase [Elusimicrobia bacterium]|nr:zinc carboxypeptidase [Elusimicrobiota bacterium]